MLTTDQNINTGLIIGCGSIGKKYLDVMLQRYNTVLIVDTNQKMREVLEKNSDKVKTFKDVKSMVLSELFIPNQIVAVISNWGPDHFYTYNELTGHGIKRIIIEKPLVNSKIFAYNIHEHSILNNILVVPAMPRRYSNIYDEITNEISKQNVGAPLMITMVGGAQCIATNGIHWLDLACQLFKSFPQSVYAKMKTSEINPRNRLLGFYEGTASWFFSDFRAFNVSLTNKSYCRSEITIVCEFGLIKFNNNGSVHLFKVSDPGKNLSSLPVTRVSETKFQKNIEIDTIVNPIENQILAAEGVIELKYTLDDAIQVISALISAFESSEINLPIEINSSQELSHNGKIWNFS